MAGPWEKYQQAAPTDGPWMKYGSAAPKAPPSADSSDPSNQPYIGAAVGTPYENPPPMGDPRLSMPGEPPTATQTVVEPDPTRSLRIGTQGAGAGAAEIIGAPVDLATAAINLPVAGVEKAVNLFRDDPVDFGRITDPVGGSQFIKDLSSEAAEQVGFTTIPESDMTTGEQLVYNINRFGTGAVAGGGALARGAQATRPGTYTHELTRPYREAVDNAATMPGPVRAEVEAAKPLVTDLAAGAGAGAGVTAADQAFPDSPIAEMVGALAGGLTGAGAATLGRAPAISARNIYERHFTDPDITPDPVTGRGVTRRTADQAARYAQAQASDPETAAVNIGRVTEEARAGAEPAPTSGIASSDVGLVAGERGQRLRDPVPFQERDQALKDAAQDRVTDIRDPGAEPRAAQRFVERDRDTRIGAAEQAQSTAQQRFAAGQEAEAELGGQVAARRGGDVTASERVAEAVGTAKSADEARKSGLYREAEQMGRDVEINPAPFAESARKVRDEIGPLAQQDSSLNNILDDLDALAPVEGEAQRLAATDLIEMTPRLSQARDAAVRLKRGNVVQRLDDITSGVKSRLLSLADEGNEAAIKWREAEENFRTDFAPKYREGVGGQLDKAERGKTPVRPTEVGGRFLGGGKEAAEDLKRILAGAESEAAGQTAARDYVLSDMAKVVGADGKINVHSLRNWIGNREGLFQAMPKLREEANQMLRDAVNRRGATTQLQKDLEQATKNLKRTEQQIQKEATSLLLDSDPANAAKRVFSARDPENAMREIVARLKGDSEATAGWKRTVVDHLIDRVTTTNTAMSAGPDGPVSIAALQRFFKSNEKTLAEVFSPKEMQSLRRAHKILEPLGNLSRQVTAGSPTIENEAMWNATEAGLLAVTGNAITTGMIMKRIRTVLKFLPNPEAQLQHLTKRMYFEPELAQHLLTRNVKEIGSSGWNAKLTQLLAAGEGAREYIDDDVEQADE